MLTLASSLSSGQGLGLAEKWQYGAWRKYQWESLAVGRSNLARHQERTKNCALRGASLAEGAMPDTC